MPKALFFTFMISYIVSLATTAIVAKGKCVENESPFFFFLRESFRTINCTVKKAGAAMDSLCKNTLGFFFPFGFCRHVQKELARPCFMLASGSMLTKSLEFSESNAHVSFLTMLYAHNLEGHFNGE